MSLVVSGMGMISSVGRNVRDSCASIRAGLARARQLDQFELLDPESLDPLPVVGHPVRAFSEGFSGAGLWLRLAERCIAEVLSDAKIARDPGAAIWGKTGLLVVTPYVDDSRYYGQGNESLDLLRPAYVGPLLKRSRLPIDEAKVGIVAAGHAGVIAALLQASKVIGKTLERVLIVAVDSYLDVLTLEWLAQQLRLKSPESPLGLMPGEAAVALLVEDADACRRRGGRPAAQVAAMHIARETAKLGSNEVNSGAGMAEAIDRVLSVAGVALPFGGDIVADLNGEEWRARELFGALQRLNSRIGAGARIITPVASTGDVGAASSGVSICAAVSAHQRRYAQQGQSLIVGSSDRGETGAALIAANE